MKSGNQQIFPRKGKGRLTEETSVVKRVPDSAYAANKWGTSPNSMQQDQQLGSLVRVARDRKLTVSRLPRRPRRPMIGPVPFWRASILSQVVPDVLNSAPGIARAACAGTAT